MKSILLSLSTLFLSQSAFAATPQEFIKEYQTTHAVRCHYEHSSKNEFCLNYTCQYQQYYSCENDSDFHTLALKIRSLRYPGEAAQNTVIGSSIQ